MQPGGHQSSGLTYRPEIDGLRAISVVSVVLFHAEFAGFGGGFVGVDVFFVISGFLITRILIEENLAGDFSLARFYERRARRILPALYVVVAASFAAALYLMLPSGLTEFSGSAIAALLFASNLYFWRYNDYFGPSAAEEPLIHTWSLGVEEQYYLLFPVLILVLWRLGIGRVAALIAAATLASLAFSEVLWRHFPEMNFYLLPSRAWQIGVGSLGAFLWHRTGGMPVPRRVGEAAAALGLALVVASVLLLDAGTPTPSLAGAGPVVGAVLVLLFATRGTITGRLLGLRPMVWIGLASYSAYLWHQPLFAFARIATDAALGIGTSLALCVLTFLLAWATLVLVERPFRNRAFLTRRQVFAGASRRDAGAAGGRRDGASDRRPEGDLPALPAGRGDDERPPAGVLRAPRLQRRGQARELRRGRQAAAAGDRQFLLAGLLQHDPRDRRLRRL